MCVYIYISLYRQYVWDKNVKATQHQHRLSDSKSEAMCHVNVTHARYFLLEFKSDTVDFVDAVADDS